MLSFGGEFLCGDRRVVELKSADISLPHLTIRSSYCCVWCGLEFYTGHMCAKWFFFFRGSPDFAPAAD